MEKMRKLIINSESFQEMVTNNPKLYKAMNSINYSSRTKDFSKG